MRMSAKGYYAVTAMLDLSLHEREGPVRLADIAQRQDFSRNFLEQLFLALRRANVVYSVRGPGGGYRLCRPARQISIAQVLRAAGEPLEVTRCGGKRNCQNSLPCLTHDLWQDLSQRITRFLGQVSLADLQKRHSVRDVVCRQDRVFHVHERRTEPQQAAS